MGTEMTRSEHRGAESLVGMGLRTVSSVGIALLCAMFWVASAHAFPFYDSTTSDNDCAFCHPGFKGGGGNALHAYHTDFLKGTDPTRCNLCHPNGGGSKPVRTYTSGTGGGLGCAGCHGQDFGETSSISGEPKATAYGLRLFHEVQQGIASCGVSGGCHVPGSLGHTDPFPEPLGEAVAPPYYSLNNNTLNNPCSSDQEDMAFDADSVGLDNDGDGFADWPADADCAAPPSTTTTTSITTTTTTLPAQCGAAPALDCVSAGKSMLFVSDKSAGKEKVKVALKNLGSAVTQGQFGNPLADGGTNYTVCIYDDANQLAGQISVSRAGDDCGSPPAPCWQAISDKGYIYKDKLSAADGVLKMVMTGGDAGKGKATVTGKNNSAKGQNSLPTGIATLLENNTQATVQLLTNDASCFGATVTQVKKADGAQFKATAP
jgi:hypothetical protein